MERKIKIETDRLILREMNIGDYDALYAVLADSDIMQHYPYSFDEKYSYMKYTNEPSAKSAMLWGCKLVDEYPDDLNEITKVYCITREEWEQM